MLVCSVEQWCLVWCVSLNVTVCERASFSKAMHFQLAEGLHEFVLTLHKTPSDEWNQIISTLASNMLLASKGSRVGWVCRVWAMGRRRKKAQEDEKWQNIPRRQGEISNALIKKLHASCAKKGSKYIFPPHQTRCEKSEEKVSLESIEGERFIIDILYSTRQMCDERRWDLPKYLSEGNFGAAHHLRSKLNFSCSWKSEYKINLGNFYCNLTLSFMFIFLISQKCLWSLQINFISPLTKRASAE